MPSLELNGVAVEFPFTPYECQKDFMTRVLECLNEKQNGVLESPTGTGKTLCLLCATLAWRDHFKDGRKEMCLDQASSSWGTSVTNRDKKIPKIIYASRTHTQLTKVVSELRNTSYRPKVCVLGSREQLCINQEVMLQESHHVKVHMCRRRVSSRSCPYYNNVEGRSSDTDLVNSIPDLEDLVKFGSKHNICPYFLTRSLMQQADMIFMPYNYLLDPKIRRAYDMDLKGAVVIFDEAHNVDKTCEESTSFDLTPYDMASAITVVDLLLVEQAKDSTEDFDVESLSSGLNLDIERITEIKMILLELEAEVNSFNVPSDRGITKPGIFIYELLERAHLTYQTKTVVNDTLEKIISHFASRPGVFLSTKGLQKLADIIQLVFCGKSAEIHEQKQKELNSAYFKVYIHQDNSSCKDKQSADLWSSSKKQGNILSYWCFSPGFSMQELKKQQVRCIILTSGTLTPLTSVTSEMRIDFPVLLENGHVIDRDQIYISVVDRGPDGVPLSSAFDRRFAPENMTSLGNTVANVSRIVPHGLLVFFPSFPLMEKTLEFWRTSGHADRINNIKPVFVEPKGQGTFNQVISGYYSQFKDPKSKAGSFFAVCRGKASEGLDFADSFGRGVVITGLPFPPKLDPRVAMKMQFLDEMCRKKTPGMEFLSGQEWYKQQAFRAVNQAIGRVIRHREDYGAIFLCDQRFSNHDSLMNLPSWVRPYVRFHPHFGNMIRNVCQFFRDAQSMRPVAIKTPAAEAPAAECLSHPSTAPAQTETNAKQEASSESSFAKRAKVQDSHLLSLKRRRVCLFDSFTSPDEKSCGSGMTTFSKSERKEGRKPSNLLNALDRADRFPRDDVAEETAPLSTLFLQCEKRWGDQVPRRKRKMRLIQKPDLSVSDMPGQDDASRLLADLKKNLCDESVHQIFVALQTYKEDNRLDDLLAKISVLFEDQHNHSLLRGFYRFIPAHHKKMFKEKCQELTELRCVYRLHHSLSE